MVQKDAELSSVRGQITLSVADIEAALRESPAGRRASWLLFGLALFLAGAYGVLQVHADGPTALSSSLLAVALAMIGLAVGDRLIGVRVKAIIGHGAMSMDERRLCFELDEQGLTIESSSWRRRLERDRIDRVVETKQTFFVYTGVLTAQIVPKRAFSPEDAARLRLWFESLPKRSRPNIALWIIAAGAAMWLLLVAMWFAIRWTLGP